MPLESTPKEAVPFLTTAQMVEVDRLAAEEYHIELIHMMENVGRNLADLAEVRFLSGDPIDKSIIVLVGTGGNGAGALVCGRWTISMPQRTVMTVQRNEVM